MPCRDTQVRQHCGWRQAGSSTQAAKRSTKLDAILVAVAVLTGQCMFAYVTPSLQVDVVTEVIVLAAELVSHANGDIAVAFCGCCASWDGSKRMFWVAGDAGHVSSGGIRQAGSDGVCWWSWCLMGCFIPLLALQELCRTGQAGLV